MEQAATTTRTGLIQVQDDKFVEVPLPNIVYPPDFESKLNQKLSKTRKTLNMKFINPMQ